MFFEQLFASFQVFKSSVGEDSEPATGRKLARHYGTACDDGESRRVSPLRSWQGAPPPVRLVRIQTRPTSLIVRHLTNPNPLEVYGLSNPLPP